jgi:hypothetical protein
MPARKANTPRSSGSNRRSGRARRASGTPDNESVDVSSGPLSRAQVDALFSNFSCPLHRVNNHTCMECYAFSDHGFLITKKPAGAGRRVTGPYSISGPSSSSSSSSSACDDSRGGPTYHLCYRRPRRRQRRQCRLLSGRLRRRLRSGVRQARWQSCTPTAMHLQAIHALSLTPQADQVIPDSDSCFALSPARLPSRASLIDYRMVHPRATNGRHRLYAESSCPCYPRSRISSVPL